MRECGPASAGRIDGGAIPRFGDRQAVFARNLEPGVDRLLHFAQSLSRRIAERRAGLEVGNVGHPARVVVGPEEVDVIAIHALSSNVRPNSSTISRNWRS